jgi:arabinofuranosyltransferase
LAVALTATVLGWRLFWFLTDDAFIAFRYVSNSQLGHGYVWNAPPFAPVEGYSSFLFVALLDLVWSVTGLEPPDAANGLSLVFALGSVALTFMMAKRALASMAAPQPLALLALTLALVVSNPTFLVWTSSGLETALFNLLIQLWFFSLWSMRPDPRSSALVSLLAALVALTRPDGYLVVLVTGLAILATLPRGVSIRERARHLVVACAPLGLVAAHLVWRLGTYGEWLPNTYYAKVVGALPESGARYLLSFVLEYTLWLPALGAVVVLARGRFTRPTVHRTLAVVALAGHTGWYCVVAGGDHFEYRVLSHLVPLIALGTVAIAVRLGPRYAVLTTTAALLLASICPWTIWHVSQRTTAWTMTTLDSRIAPSLPGPLATYGGWLDAQQAWLHERTVCMRYQQHRLFAEHMLAFLPKRDAPPPWPAAAENPVVQASGVGVVGWVFPSAHVLDWYGLNDWVVARTPVQEVFREHVAHARRPPPGYFEAFEPLLYVEPTRVWRGERRAPLTADRVALIERAGRAEVLAR